MNNVVLNIKKNTTISSLSSAIMYAVDLEVMLTIRFLFCLALDLEIPMKSKLTLINNNSICNSGKSWAKEKMFRCRKFKLFLLFSCLFILSGSLYSCRLCPLFSDTVLILLKNFILIDYCFSSTCVKLTFLPFKVCINSSLFKLKNRRNSSVQMMQNHLVFFSFWRSLCVCLFILLHSQWTHMSQVSHWILRWFLAKGRL